ncbi:MAG: SMI1/KNR4 family protein [Actinomycetota bacterium]|nr:SMI1/KNR4 family protein [Actinomycetota bacterium]
MTAALTLTEDGGPATEAEIAAAERQLGVSIPMEYREFLAQHNGARPVFNYFAGSERWNLGVTDFFGVGSFDDVALLRERVEYQDRVPPWLLPVAETEGGNLICIALEGEDTGAVYFWFHEGESDEGEPPATDNLYRLANSFKEYLAGLRPDVEQSHGAPPTAVWVDPDFEKELGEQ